LHERWGGRRREGEGEGEGELAHAREKEGERKSARESKSDCAIEHPCACVTTRAKDSGCTRAGIVRGVVEA